MVSFGGLSVLLAILDLVIGFPASIEKDPKQGDFYEGDMLLSEEQMMMIEGKSRNGLIDEKWRWPNKIVYYKFADRHFDDAHRNHVLRAMQLVEEVSCIRFLPANETSKAFINITTFPTGCHSAVGFQNAPQQVNLEWYELDKGCFTLGSIVHEFLHALGFFHQQSASNRDKYVKILFENITPGMEHNFNIYNSSVIDDFGIEYDIHSVMHYGSYFFSKNGKKTIVPVSDENGEVGQGPKMTAKLKSPKRKLCSNIKYSNSPITAIHT